MIKMMKMWMFFLRSFGVVFCSLLVNLECHNCHQLSGGRNIWYVWGLTLRCMHKIS